MDEFELNMVLLIKSRVERFGKEIIETLVRNTCIKRKGDWSHAPKEILIQKLYEEFNELIEALSSDDPKKITLECTDLSAITMFIYDNFGEKSNETKE